MRVTRLPSRTDDSSTKPHRVGPSGAALVGLGSGTLALACMSTYVLAELVTPGGVAVVDADLSGIARTVGLIVAGALAVPGAVLAYRRQKALDHANSLKEAEHKHKEFSDNREHAASRERNLRDRYTTCAEQLAHNSPSVQIAGVYGLASLAEDWHSIGKVDERQVCVDLLCAVLRSPRDTAKEVRSTILRILLKRRGRIDSPWDEPTEDPGWTQVHYDLTGADLSEMSLNRADLSYARLDGANLTNVFLIQADLDRSELPDANLSGAYLQSATFLGAFLDRATLTDACFVDADLTDAHLSSADLTRADLTRALFCTADLDEANLTGADLTDAELIGAILTDANLTDANLTGADITGADLTGANLTGANLTRVRWSADTTWPEGFEAPLGETSKFAPSKLSSPR